LFAEDHRYPDRVESKPLDAQKSLKYTPRSTNASMDETMKARKKDREKIASLEETAAVLTSSLKKATEEKANIVIPPREEVAKEEVPRFKMERAARLAVKPIYVIVKEKYPHIDEL
jgi:hypothetical protein